MIVEAGRLVAPEHGYQIRPDGLSQDEGEPGRREDEGGAGRERREEPKVQLASMERSVRRYGVPR